jgi:triacylglycerol esterase/lipase EstA (alpha/beta hydrolase family)
MKYWDNLRSVEDQIVRLDSVESILRVLGNADATREDMLNVLWYLDGAVEDINKNLSDNFYKLWDEVRNDSYEEMHLESLEKFEATKRFEQILKPFVHKE